MLHKAKKAYYASDVIRFVVPQRRDGMLFWSLPRQRDVMPYRSPGCAEVLRGARADVKGFSYMTLMDKSAAKHNMLKNLASSALNTKPTTVKFWYDQWRQKHLGPREGKSACEVGTVTVLSEQQLFSKLVYHRCMCIINGLILSIVTFKSLLGLGKGGGL